MKELHVLQQLIGNVRSFGGRKHDVFGDAEEAASPEEWHDQAEFAVLEEPHQRWGHVLNNSNKMPMQTTS